MSAAKLGGLGLLLRAAVVDDLAKVVCKIGFLSVHAPPLGKLGGVIYADNAGPRGGDVRLPRFSGQALAPGQRAQDRVPVRAIHRGDLVPVQAVAGPSLFGPYYLFPSLQKKNCMRTTYSIADKSYTYKIMWIDLNGGLLIHVVANQEYEYNGEGKSVSTYGEDYNADKPDLEHCQYFWLSNDRMPEQFILTGQDSQTDFILGLADMGYPKY